MPASGKTASSGAGTDPIPPEFRPFALSLIPSHFLGKHVLRAQVLVHCLAEGLSLAISHWFPVDCSTIVAASSIKQSPKIIRPRSAHGIVCATASQSDIALGFFWIFVSSSHRMIYGRHNYTFGDIGHIGDGRKKLAVVLLKCQRTGRRNERESEHFC